MFRRGGGRMIFERRAYTMNPGRVPAFDRAQVDRGFDLVRPFMERLVGYFSTRAGTADQIVHRYDDLEDWNARLRGLYGVPELTPYFVNTRKMVRRQVNGFFEPLPFAALNPLWGEDRDWLPGIGKPLAPLDGAVVVEERSFRLRPGGVPAFVDALQVRHAAHGGSRHRRLRVHGRLAASSGSLALVPERRRARGAVRGGRLAAVPGIGCARGERLIDPADDAPADPADVPAFFMTAPGRGGALSRRGAARRTESGR